MFRNQFQIAAREKQILQKICVFIVIFYVKIWFTAPNAINAPNSDLQLVKDLIDYRKIHPEIANAALDKLSRHLWYLHEQLACLALFDKTVSIEEKIKIIQKMNSQVAIEKPNKRFAVAYDEITSLSEKNISDFVNSNSLFIFEQFELPYEFLCSDPSLWESNLEYKRCYDTFKTLKVVNDTAERGVALAESFYEVLTHNEDERQRIFQTVQHHRSQYTSCNKSQYVDNGSL